MHIRMRSNAAISANAAYTAVECFFKEFELPTRQGNVRFDKEENVLRCDRQAHQASRKYESESKREDSGSAHRTHLVGHERETDEQRTAAVRASATPDNWRLGRIRNTNISQIQA